MVVGSIPIGVSSISDFSSPLIKDPYIKIIIKEELKFSKQENDLFNSNTEIVKSFEKELEFLKQDLVNKNKLKELYTSKIFGNAKDNSKGSNFDLYTDLSIPAAIF